MKKRSKRIQILCSLLAPCETFADVGCDHGYCSEYMLKNGLCARAILSDIAEGSLEKAKTLLCAYVEQGKATAVLGDGFVGVPKTTDQVLIAGMGGCEMIGILSHSTFGFMPKRFVLQPMKDSEKVRRYLLENGGYIERDFTFLDGGKFYDVIVGRKRNEGEEAQTYSSVELQFGKENIKERGEDFLCFLDKQIENLTKYLLRPLQEGNRNSMEERKKYLEGVKSGETL